jgi:hypothetical protein
VAPDPATTGTDIPRYEHLAVAPQQAHIVHVSVINSDPAPNVWRGQLTGAVVNWSGVYRGPPTAVPSNLTGGWIEAPRPTGLG